MSHGTPSLSTILDASVPVLGNRELLEAVAITRGRPILALVLGPRTLDSACIPHLYDVLGSIGAGAFDLFLGPLGPAVAEVGRVAGLLAEHGRFDALVPFEASPAATLLAFAAERIWMGPAATLAPLLAADAPDATARALLELLAHAPSDTRPAALSRWWGDLDPRILGQSVRLRHDLEALARRCLEVGGQAAPAAAVQRFTAVEGPDLPLISAECLALGLPIHSPGPGLYRALVGLHRYYVRMLELEGEMTWRQHRYAVAYEAFIDTPSERRILLRITRADDHGRPLRDGPTVWRWVRPSGREIAIDQVMEL